MKITNWFSTLQIIVLFNINNHTMLCGNDSYSISYSSLRNYSFKRISIALIQNSYYNCKYTTITQMYKLTIFLSSTLFFIMLPEYLLIRGVLRLVFRDKKPKIGPP